MKLGFSEPRADGDVVENLHHFFTVQLPPEARTRENKLLNKIDNSALELGAGVLVPPRDLIAEDMAAKVKQSSFSVKKMFLTF